MALTERPRGTAKDRALRLLGVRARGREELRRRLWQAGFEDAEIAAALNDLEAVGLIDDERFARDVAALEMGRRALGPRAALASLRRRGIAPDLAERVIEEESPPDEEDRALAVARDRLSRMNGLPDDVLSRRLVGFLLRRGYEAGVSYRAVRIALADRERAG